MPVYYSLPESTDIFGNTVDADCQIAMTAKCDQLFPPTGERICSVLSQIVREQGCVTDYNSSEPVPVHSSFQQFIAQSPQFEAISEIAYGNSQSSSPESVNNSPTFIASQKEQAKIYFPQ